MAAIGTKVEPRLGRGRGGGGLAHRLRRGFAQWWFAYAMLAPVMIVLAVIVLYPLARGINYAFTDASRYNFGSKFKPASYHHVGFRNFREILTGGLSKEFRSVFSFTLVWTFVNVFFHFTIGLGLAMLLNRQLKARTLYRVLLMVPWAVPAFISAYTWQFIFSNPFGFLYHVLVGIGMKPDDVPAFLGDPTWAKVSVIATNVWLGVPFMMVALLGGLQAIDRELLDAAAVDGASAWQRFWHVTLPGLRPVAATVILLGIIWTFNMFAIIYLVTSGGPADATQILATKAFALFAAQQYGIAAAYGVIILSLLLVFAGFYRTAVRRAGEESWA